MKTSSTRHESGTKIKLIEHQVKGPDETLATVHWIVTLPVSKAEVSGVSWTKAQAIADAKFVIEGDLENA